MTDLPTYIAQLALVDPSLAQMAQGLSDEGVSIAAVKLRVRAAMAKVCLHPDAVRDEVARILEIVAQNGLDGPKDIDVAVDALLCTVPSLGRY